MNIFYIIGVVVVIIVVAGFSRTARLMTFLFEMSANGSAVPRSDFSSCLASRMNQRAICSKSRWKDSPVSLSTPVRSRRGFVPKPNDFPCTEL